MRAGLVLLEFSKQCLLANGFALLLLGPVWHVPAVAGILNEARVLLVEVADVLVVRREVAVNLAGTGPRPS